ncbi:MAG: TonB-dependent receptor, partial [Chitinophagales bacterium]|nr:TonB-dependent receptor [Chitinophagales bacterium]
DWTWNTVATASFEDGNGVLQYFEFDPKGVHVGDAAQIQAAGMIRYEPIRNLYFKLKYTYFAKHYADFQPEDLDEEDLYGRESWKTPSYGLMDFHAGYKLPIKDVDLRISFNALNLLGTKYISDARNNDSFNRQPFDDFDAKSASVFFGQGFRYSTSIKLKI